MPSPGFRLRGAFRSCHACRLRKVRCIYPEGQQTTCERCRDAGVQCIPAAKTTRKSNWRRSVEEAVAQRAPKDAAPEKEVQPTQSAPASPHDLPSYIKPIPTHLSASAIAYLQERQAFTIPNDKVRDAILESYFEFYHTSMPLIDPVEFAESITQNNGQLSLLLLQSMLFVGSTYLDFSVLRELGLSTNKEARKLFFERARLLHECDCEEDQYISAQALLLLSIWYEPTERKETSYWLGCAISAMQMLPKSTFSASRANRRLWWSIYLRDRSLNWSSRRPLRLHTGDYHVQELALEDFYSQASGFTGSRFVKNPEDQEDNALVCMELIKLHATISDLTLLRPGMQDHIAPTDFAEDRSQNPNFLFTEHLKWPSRLPENLQYQSPPGVLRSRCLSLQLSMMHLTYWASIIEYCELLPANSPLPAYISEHTTSPVALSNHAIQVIHTIIQHLKDSHYLSYVPLAGVVVLSRCIAPLIRQLEALPSLNSFTLSRYLAELMDAMQPFRSTYTIAEHIFKVFCLGLRQIILRDATQILFIDIMEVGAWNIENIDSIEEIDRLYKSLRILLVRLDNEDSPPNLPANSFYTPPSSTSGQTPDSTQPTIYTGSSTPAATSVQTSETVDSHLSSFQQQMPYTSDFLMDENMNAPLDSGFDARDLMSMEQFEQFCAQFGFNDELGMRFS